MSGRGSLPAYANLEWRLDVEVARRRRHNVAEPTLVVKLDTQTEDDKASHVFECDAATLRYLEDQMKAAMATLETPSAKRAQKYIK